MSVYGGTLMKKPRDVYGSVLAPAQYRILGESGTAPTPEVKHVCETCGKECKTALALNGHKRTHK